MNSQSLGMPERDFLCAVALNTLVPLARDRTLQAGFHILRGRKANQTLQDVHLYSLYPYYRLFPRITKEEWEKIILLFLNKGYIKRIPVNIGSTKSSFQVTGTGEEFARERFAFFELQKWFQPFSQVLPSRDLEVFWQRLHLLVQTVSQIAAGELQFLPVVRDRAVQQWVKRQLVHAASRIRWETHLGEELFRLWEPLPDELQMLLTAQLSGAAQAGKTMIQLAVMHGQAPSFLRVKFRYALAVSMERLRRGRASFPLLGELVKASDEEDVRLSESASRTYALVRQGVPKEEIARIRGIKESTVEDHLVEIALRCPEWDCSDLLPPDLAVLIVQTGEQLGTSRLRLIRDHLQGRATYLQIRLALARRQEGIRHA